MKRLINKSIILGMLSLTLIGAVSCKKYLDKEPATDVDPTAFYKSFNNFQGFTEELYSCIPVMDKQDNNNMWNWGEEEMNSPNGKDALLGRFDRGDFWVSTGFWLDGALNTNPTDRRTHYLWSGAWYGIRKANLGIANLDKFQGTTEEKNLLAGQLYFFRAWFHLHLMNFWGGMPYIDKDLPADESPRIERLTWQQGADKVAADFKRAADLLPINWDNTTAGVATFGNNELRINKIMAMSYLGKTFLYAGSPLMNKVSTGNANYDVEYCKKAADAFGEVLKMVEAGQTQYGLVSFDKYSDILYTNGQAGRMPGLNEAIFRGPSYDWGATGLSLNRQYLAAQILESRSWSLYPSANYVNYFGMANGLPINEQNSSSVADAESGYDPQYPWKNRDPRFYLTFGFDTQRMVLGSLGTNEQWRYANLSSYASGTTEERRWSYRIPETGSPSGYLLIKFDPVGFNRFDNKFNSQHIHIPWLRLADVYLMYAEAAAMGNGSPGSASTAYPALTALGAVDKIRTRATVPVFAPKFRSNTTAFMKELQRERAVELAWEGHRFNDLRRWLLFDKYPYNIKTSIEFDRADKVNYDKVDPTKNKVLNLRDVVVIERKFTEKHYWLPIKRSDVDIYPGFYQNPGW